MSEPLRIWPEEWRPEGDRLTVGVTLEWPDGARDSLWYRVPPSAEPALTPQLDPFAVAVVMLAMHRRTPVRFHGTVSPSLLANLEEYQTVWNFWRPADYAQVELSADQEREATPGQGGAIISFSGGVDACYSVLRHVQGLPGRRTAPIGAGLLVEGFDIPVGDPGFAAAAAGAARILDSLGIPLITATTNWREIEQRHGLNWTHGFGSAVIACLSLFSGRYPIGILGSGDRYYDVRPHGSTPLTDPLLGSSAFRVRHDGAAASRIEKVSVIAEWPAALHDLRVCWEGPEPGRNCSRCEKCIRTILNFRVLGLPMPPAFAHDVTLEQLRRLPIGYMALAEEFESIVEYAEANGRGTEPWVSALRHRIAGFRRNPDDEPITRLLRRRVARVVKRLVTRLRGL